MAVTFKTSIPVEPAKRKTGATVLNLPEVSSGTFPRGQILSRNGGYLQENATGGYVSANLYGVAADSGHNASAVGVNNIRVYRFEADRPFKAAVSGSVAASQLGATVAISANSLGAIQLITAATASDSSAARLVDFAEGAVAGDVNPVMYFVPVTSKIQEG